MTRYLRLVAIQVRISLATAMAYRANFVVEGLMSLIWTSITLLPLIVLFDQRTEVAGWDKSSALIVLGYFYGVRAVLEGTISPSLAALVARIRNGSFDYTLLKPVDAQIMISTAQYEPWRALELLTAIGMIVYAFTQRGTPPRPPTSCSASSCSAPASPRPTRSGSCAPPPRSGSSGSTT